MEFDRQGRIYWDSLTLKQKFEWDYLDIDPTTSNNNDKLVCEKHFETYKSGGECSVCKKQKR